MRLLSLELENWGPYRGTQILNLDCSPEAPITLIEGENERGKTSIFSGLRWALYGAVKDQAGRSLPMEAFANWDERDSGTEFGFGVTLRFEVTTNDKVEEIEVLRKARAKGVTLNSRPSVELLETRTLMRVVGGTPFPERDIDPWIQRLLHPDVSDFFLFDGETLSRFEERLKSEEAESQFLRTSIERALGIPALRLLRGDVKFLRESAEAAVRRAAEATREAKRWEDKLKQNEDEIQRAESDLEELHGIQTDLTEEIHGLTKQLDQVATIRDDLIKRRNLEEQRAVLDSDLQDAEAEMAQLLEERWWLPLSRLLIQEAEASQTAFDAASQAQQERTRLSVLLQERERQLQDPRCLTCGQTMPPEALSDLMRERDDFQQQLDALSEDEDFDDLAERARRLRPYLNLESRVEQVRGAEQNCRLIRWRIIQAETQIEEISSRIQDDSIDVASLDANVAQRRAALNEVQEEIDLAEKRRDKAIQERSDITSAIAEASPEAADAKIELDVLKTLEGYLEAAIDEFRTGMRKEVQDVASEIFSQITAEPEYQRLRIDGNYHLSIVDGNDRVVVRPSAGASQVVTMALIGALARCSVDEGPIVIDTPFGRLDRRHRHRILSWVAHLGSQVVLLVQSGEFERDRDLTKLEGKVGRAYRLQRLGPQATMIVGEGS